ncbi:MAG: sulfatase-like hydrolase/transferase [Candidatus Sumerlaeota bacterium]|nr:sulfatase-like hydrolase/transferase [Candidatus Sumerlaeota bacterium]
MNRRNFMKRSGSLAGAAALAGGAMASARPLPSDASDRSDASDGSDKGVPADASSSVSASASTAGKPDILFLMPDQWRGDCLSSLGHPVVRTPNLDALASQGTRFSRAYTTIFSCIPARYALLTGQFPQTSGVVGFKAKPITSPTFPQFLRDAGYATALVGRNMHQAAQSEALGYQQSILGSTYVSNDQYDVDLKKEAPDSGGIDKVIAGLKINCNGWQAKPWPLADNLHPTEWIVQKTKEVIAAAQSNQPLFLTSSFYSPHPPLFAPKKYFDAYLKKDLPKPAHGDWVDWNAIKPADENEGGARPRVLLTGDILRAAQAGYFGLIEHLDEQMASLIAAFRTRSEKAGRAWVIVFSTDHGEMLGDHGYFRKCEPYEGSSHIPFIIAGSSALGFRPGSRCPQPVCLEDIMPTLLDLAAVKCPEVDGVSLAPILRGAEKTIRPWLHFEHAPCYSQEQAFHALTDGRMKYLWRPKSGAEQLFDLEKDPHEERNLATDASRSGALEQWRGRLVARLAGRPEGFSDGKQLFAGRPYPPLQAPAAKSNSNKGKQAQ